MQLFEAGIARDFFVRLTRAQEELEEALYTVKGLRHPEDKKPEEIPELQELQALSDKLNQYTFRLEPSVVFKDIASSHSNTVVASTNSVGGDINN